VRRLAILGCTLLAAVGFAAAAALPTQAALTVIRTLAGTSTGTTSTTTTGTGSTTTTTTTTSKRKTSGSRGVRVTPAFPAAGDMLVPGVAVRRTPSPRARVVKVMHSFRPDYRPQEIFAVGKKTGKDGQVWYRISVPMRPNGKYGWIPASVVELKPTVSKIVVNVGSRTIDVYRRGKHVWHGQVAVGAPGMETPRGHYYVTARFVPYKDPFLGVFAVETSAYSRLTEWPGGGVVGIHGTDMPWLLGKAVSHGCVRVSNQSARALRRYAPLGTPILIKG
jgi:lipoprotein-anchoring transpeptidase ErfK/SrfK